MAGARNVLARSTILHSQRSLVDLLACRIGHDVDAEDAVGAGCRKHLHEALALVVDLHSKLNLASNSTVPAFL